MPAKRLLWPTNCWIDCNNAKEADNRHGISHIFSLRVIPFSGILECLGLRELAHAGPALEVGAKLEAPVRCGKSFTHTEVEATEPKLNRILLTGYQAPIRPLLDAIKL